MKIRRRQPVSESDIPSVGWNEFLNSFQWEQGEHVTFIGPTKSGKTTLANRLLADARKNRTHPWQVVLATKPRDEVLDEYVREGFQKLEEWVVSDPDLYPKVLLAPKMRSVEDVGAQREAFKYGLISMFRQGGWLVYLDELRHICTYLKLERDVELMLHQGRSAGITVVGSVQRPRHVPLMAYDQATHLFMWQTRDSSMRDRLAEIGGRVDPDLVQAGLSMVQYHQFLYVNPIDGIVVRSEVEV